MQKGGEASVVLSFPLWSSFILFVVVWPFLLRQSYSLFQFICHALRVHEVENVFIGAISLAGLLTRRSIESDQNSKFANIMGLW